MCLEVGPVCYVAKSDFKAAFRNLPIKPQDQKLLVMKAKNPAMNKWMFFVDKCLPFGSSVSCSHFQRVSNTIEHIFRKTSGSKANNYLDDFLFTTLLKCLSDGNVQMFLDICEQINFPVAMDKTFRGSQIVIFLGMLLDTVNQTVSIPVKKKG